MSGKASYAIFLSFMALFAALAAHAGEPAAKEHDAVISAARAGNQAAYAAALIRYSERLSKEFAPKEVAASVTPAAAPAEDMAFVDALKPDLAKTETPTDTAKVALADKSAVSEVTKTESAVTDTKASSFDALLATANPESRKLYSACLQAGPAECCPAVIDKHATMPEACGTYAPSASATNRSISSSM